MRPSLSEAMIEFNPEFDDEMVHGLPNLPSQGR